MSDLTVDIPDEVGVTFKKCKDDGSGTTYRIGELSNESVSPGSPINILQKKMARQHYILHT